MSTELVQGSPEWLAFRKTKIGSSDAPQILSVLPRFKESPKPSWMGTPFQLWCRKSDRLPEKAVTPQMTRGTRLEQTTIMPLVQQHFGCEFVPRVFTSMEFDWMVASLDGYCAEFALGEHAGEHVEIKAPGLAAHNTTTDVPWYYWVQMQHQLAVTTALRGFYVSYHPEGDPPLIVLPVQRDDDFIRGELIPAEEQFQFCLVSDTAPPLTDRDERVRLDPEWTELAEEYRRAESVVSEWEGKRKAAREALIAMADGVPRCRGGGILLSLSEKKGNVQYDRIPQLKGLNLDEFRAPSRMEHRLTVERGK